MIVPGTRYNKIIIEKSSFTIGKKENVKKSGSLKKKFRPDPPRRVQKLLGIILIPNTWGVVGLFKNFFPLILSFFFFECIKTNFFSLRRYGLPLISLD